MQHSQPYSSVGEFCLPVPSPLDFHTLFSHLSTSFLCSQGHVSPLHALAEISSSMNKRQSLTMLKETKQRETLDQRGLAQFQGQIQRQMLVLFQNKKRKIPSFPGRALFISPPSQAVSDLWVLKTPNTFFFHQDPRSLPWPSCPCFWMVCLSLPLLAEHL